MTSTLDALFPGRQAVLLDGAMGSQLRHEGWPVDRPTALANLDAPGMVAAIHASHREVGARVLVTNSFSALMVDDERCLDAVAAGARIARKVAGDGLRVAAGLAAFGLASPAFAQVLGALVDEGVDLLVFETCTSPRHAAQALELAERHAPRLPVVVCASTTDGSREDRGRARAVLDVLASAADPRVTAGINCCRGPHDALRLAMEREPLVGWLKPSTGLPGERVDDNVMAGFARAARLQGARYVGGCCGTTAETLAAMGAALTGVDG